MERRSIFRDILTMARGDLSLLISLVIIVILVICGICPQYLVREDYRDINLPARLSPPSLRYPLGTDFLGRDLLSLLIWGCRLALVEMLWPTLVAATIGVSLGLISGYVGGTPDLIIMRFVDILMSFPSFLLAMVILSTLGPGLTNAIWSVAISRISGYTRLARSLALPMKEIGYVEYAKAVGANRPRIMTRYILPNILTPIIVQMTFGMPDTLSSVAALSFLGLGGKPPTADWGIILQQSRIYLRYAPWAVLIPAFIIFMVTFVFNVFGEALRDIVDPRRKYLRMI